MRNLPTRFGHGLLGAVIMGSLVGAATAFPSPMPAEDAQVMVTVRSKRAGDYPAISHEDVRVFEDKQKCTVVSWVPAKDLARGLDLTVLLDDSLLPAVTPQVRESADFFPNLPKRTRVRIAYAAFGGNAVAQDFTTDYASAERALRPPLGSAAIGGGIYESVEALIKQWPRDGSRREILLISNGIDVNEGLADSAPDLNSTLARLIKAAQRSGTTIYTIFARGAADFGNNELLLDNGQGCLLRLAAETGGQAFFQGMETPLDFTSIVKQFIEELDHQYVLTIQPSPDAGKGFQPLRVTTEVPGVDLVAPQRIYISKDEN